MKNPNPTRPNKNTLYLAMSGAGKSQALKQNPEIPKHGVLVLLFDPNHDHECYRVRGGIGEFAAVVAQALAVLQRDRRGARLAWEVNPSPENFEQFCRVVNATLDGGRETYVIAEELPIYNESNGKAAPQALRMINTGRKYGLVFHGTAQRPTEIPKSYYDNCEILFIGRQKTHAAARRMAAEVDIAPDVLRSLPDLAFYHHDGKQPAKLVQLQYQK